MEQAKVTEKRHRVMLTLTDKEYKALCKIAKVRFLKPTSLANIWVRVSIEREKT